MLGCKVGVAIDWLLLRSNLVLIGLPMVNRNWKGIENEKIKYI